MSDTHGRDFRLSWEDPKATRNSLPAGEYVVKSYRIIKEAPDGQIWHFSASKGSIKPLTIVAGKDSRLDLSSTIIMNSRMDTSQADTQIRMEIQGENKSGLTIYRAGKRIPMAYEITGADGVLKATGTMGYG